MAKLLPTGECWCGCGAETSVGAFFKPGHDKVAESMMILIKYGGVPEFLEAEGYGPSGKNLREAYEHWQLQGGKAR